uniref:Uncharacterized protein n=1 Tax=Dermatophagoides pteronyssinus TaxID=6956 RepID=A0A6P6YEG0_DERPT|nr:putative uncharacterized protein DDB_G0282499 [Dermatophagoides pteronyssinus]
MELVNLNLQKIAKWFENGCEFGMTNNNDNNSKKDSNNNICNKGTTMRGNQNNRMVNSDGGDTKKENRYYILECNDICLLSKLSDIQCDTLLDRVHKQMMTITDPYNRKEFLLSIVNEFLRDGRKTIALQAINDEIENRTELYQQFKSDLLFYRALCHFKMDRPTEALIDMYGGLDNSMIQKIDSIHKQLMEETGKFLKNNKLSNEQVVIVKDSYQMTLIEILKQYEFEVSRLCQQSQQQTLNNDHHGRRQHTKWQFKNSNHYSWKFYNNNDFLNISSNSSYVHWPRLQQNPSTSSSSSSSSSSASASAATNNSDRIASTSTARLSQTQEQENRAITITYKNKLMATKPNPLNDYYFDKNNNNYGNNNNNPLEMDKRPMKLCDQQRYNDMILQQNNEHVIDSTNNESGNNNIYTSIQQQQSFNISISLSTNMILSIKYRLDNLPIIVRKIFNEPIIDNIFHLKAILIENLCHDYNIDLLYEILVHFDFRICKQNQIRSSKECYFWRTTGCQNYDCKFYHNRCAKGVDYQEWMRINTEPPSSLINTANNHNNSNNNTMYPYE